MSGTGGGKPAMFHPNIREEVKRAIREYEKESQKVFTPELVPDYEEEMRQFAIKVTRSPFKTAFMASLGAFAGKTLIAVVAFTLIYWMVS